MLDLSKTPAAGRWDLPVSSMIKVPQQSRSAQMVHHILDGAMSTIERGGMSAFTTQAAALAAGISVGSLYQYFANKELIVAGIIERSVIRSQSQLREAFTPLLGVPAEEMLHLVLHGLFDYYEPYFPLVAELLSTMPLLSRTSVPAMVEPAVSELLRSYLALHGRGQSVDQAHVYVVLNSGIYMFFKWIVERPPHVSRDALVRALVRHGAYLLTPTQS